MIGSGFFFNCQRALIERRRFGELFFFLVEVGEIVQTGGHGPILGAQCIFPDSQGAKGEPLGFGKVVLFLVNRGQAVEVGGQVEVVFS